MEAITMNAMQTQALQGVPAQEQGTLALAGGLQDVFAALFAQLLNNAGEEGQNPEMLLAGLMNMGGKKKEEDPQLLAMQLMAQSLFAPQAADLSFLQPAQAQQLAAVQDVLAQTGVADTAAMTANAAGVLQALQPDETGETRDAAWDEMLETLTAAWESTGGDRAEQPVTLTMMDELRFQSAVRAVRQTLAEKPRTGEDARQAPLDIEALQQAVNSRQYLGESAAAGEKTPDIREIADQLKTGILENMRQGKNEFVVRLKPAGLGEITVKFTESKNEIALRIVTSSAAVGKMIANDVNALQNALRPLRAEVQEIVTVPPSGEAYAAGASLADDQGRQQFAWHNNGQNAQHSRQKNGGDEFEAMVEEIAPDDANVNLLI